MADARACLEGNIELAKKHLVLEAIHHLQDTISTCYGTGEYYNSNFSDERMKALFYKVNEVACEIYEDYDKEKQRARNGQ
ncbi:MAG: hypothetical protein NC218_03285 [Acetobacter sp.]|nr:hypothetical protein [Acetobacter sp.]